MQLDGSVCVWDGAESRRLHVDALPWPDKGNIVVRAPTYQTRLLAHINRTDTTEDVTEQSIVSMQCTADGNTSGGGELVCCSASGTVHVYMLLHHTQHTLHTVTQHAEHDLGLTPGSSMKLVHTTSVRVYGVTHGCVNDHR